MGKANKKEQRCKNKHKTTHAAQLARFKEATKLTGQQQLRVMTGSPAGDEVISCDVALGTNDVEETGLSTATVRIAQEDETDLCTATVKIEEEEETDLCTATVKIEEEEETDLCSATIKIEEEEETDLCAATVMIAEEEETDMCIATIKNEEEEGTGLCTATVRIAEEEETDLCTATVKIEEEEETALCTPTAKIEEEEETGCGTASALQTDETGSKSSMGIENVEGAGPDSTTVKQAGEAKSELNLNIKVEDENMESASNTEVTLDIRRTGVEMLHDGETNSNVETNQNLELVDEWLMGSNAAVSFFQGGGTESTATDTIQIDKAGSAVRDTSQVNKAPASGLDTVDVEATESTGGETVQVDQTASGTGDRKVEITASTTQDKMHVDKTAFNVEDLSQVERNTSNDIDTLENSDVILSVAEKDALNPAETAETANLSKNHQDVKRLSARLDEFECTLHDKNEVILSLKERLAKHHEHVEQQKIRKEEHKKLLGDMKFLKEQNKLLEAEISKLRKQKEHCPRIPSETFQLTLIDKVKHCKKFAAILQNDLDSCRKGISSPSQLSHSDMGQVEPTRNNNGNDMQLVQVEHSNCNNNENNMQFPHSHMGQVEHSNHNDNENNMQFPRSNIGQVEHSTCINNENNQPLKRRNISKPPHEKDRKKQRYVVPKRISWRLELILYRGYNQNVSLSTIDGTRIVKFNDQFSTVSAPFAVIPCGKKAWYEVQYTDLGTNAHRVSFSIGGQQIGWGASDFPKYCNITDTGVGDKKDSYGFDPFYGYKYHGGGESWGKCFQNDQVGYVGVAVDMIKGEIWFSLNGVWDAPMGSAFTEIPSNAGLFPALSGYDATLEVNFGDKEFKYGPPDPTFLKLVDVLV